MENSIKSDNSFNISKLTLGTVQLGLNYNIQNSKSKPDAKESFNILEYALNAGINTLDTARTYGAAELIIGNYKEKKPDQLINIVTKFKINGINLNHFSKARVEAYNSVKESLTALGIKKIPICLFHKDKDQPINSVMKILPGILQNLIEDDLIEIGGISVNHPDELKYVPGQELIKAIQAPMNVFDLRLKQSGLLNQLYSEQKLIFIRSVFLRGLFFMDNKNLKGNLMGAGKYLKILHDIADQAGMSVAQLAFSYVRDMEEVTSIVFGADNVGQVRQNIAFNETKRLDTFTTKAIEREFKNLPESIITPQLWNI